MNLERFDWRAILSIAVISMLIQQAFSYVCQIALPILADRLADDFGISRAWLGFYLFLQNVAAIIGAMGCGGFILRYGAVRISQWCLILMGGSLFIISIGWLWLYPLGAILLGMAAVSTPASSHILARVCPTRLAPVIFSVKQTGVPVGSLIGGLLIPFLLSISFYSASMRTPIHLDAYGTAFVTGMIVYLVVLALQPIRAHFDADRKPDVKLTFSGVSETMKFVVSDPQLRDLSFGALAFGGLQSIFSGFFILFMIDGMDYSEAEAGSAFAIAATSAVVARIFWGYLGGSVTSARVVLGGIGIFAGIAAILTGFYEARWSYSLILGVAVLYNISALSWHGILLAEIARLAPRDKVGGVTGAVLSFTSIAMMIYPAFYGGLLAVTDSYGVGFILCSIPSFIAGAIFLRRPSAVPWTRSVLNGIIWCMDLRRIAFGGMIAVIGAIIGAFMLNVRMV
ncbi:MAG: MFS transporter [Pseudomonadota bacterium]|nr:MFS transporter [Pseudomonadota bacterium]